MKRTGSGFSRRLFLKGAGMIACVPLIPELLQAKEVANLNAPPNQYRILCCNIRVALPADDEAGVGWEKRKSVCIAVMKKYKPDLISLQEVLKVQNEDLKKAFPGYFSFGFEGPEMDAFKEGYHGIAKNPIFFSKKRFTLVSAGTFWLSETPLLAGSVSWDTARARNASWLRLKDNSTGKEFRIVNVHLDHIGQPARLKQIQVVLDEAKQYPSDFPQILTGDFNSSTENGVYAAVKANGWIDSYAALHGNEAPYTFHQFKGEQYEKKDKGAKIDFVFSTGPVKPVAAAIIRDQIDGIYPSDHYFVSADLLL